MQSEYLEFYCNFDEPLKNKQWINPVFDDEALILILSCFKVLKECNMDIILLITL